MAEKPDYATASKKTAMTRRALSAPTRALLAAGRIPKSASVLNHGRGKAQHDADALAQAAGQYAEHDPNHAPNPEALDHVYDIVISNYVLNVLPPDIRQEAWKDIARATGGVAYITVRSSGDKSIKGKKYKDGVITSLGTFQKPFTSTGLTREAKKYFKNVEVIMGRQNGISWTIAASDPKYTQNDHAQAIAAPVSTKGKANMKSKAQQQRRNPGRDEEAILDTEISDIKRRAGIDN